MEWFASRFSGLVLLIINPRSMMILGVVFLILAIITALQGHGATSGSVFGGMSYLCFTLAAIVHSVIAGSDIHFS